MYTNEGHNTFSIDVIRCLKVGSIIFLPQLRNSASGLFRQLHSIPNAQEDMTSVVYLAR